MKSRRSFPGHRQIHTHVEDKDGKSSPYKKVLESMPSTRIIPTRVGVRQFSPHIIHRPVSKRLLSSSGTNSPSRGVKLKKQDFDYCVDLVQNRDRESYLCGLLMPYESRRSYFAIRALNVELASIKDGSISRQVGGAQFEESGASMALKIRVHWWRDAISQIYNGESTTSSDPFTAGILSGMSTSCWNNPVVRALDYAVQEHNLTRRFLERLVEAREEDLDISQLESTLDALSYAESTFSSLLYLSLETTNVSDAVLRNTLGVIGSNLLIAFRFVKMQQILWRIMVVLALDW